MRNILVILLVSMILFGCSNSNERHQSKDIDRDLSKNTHDVKRENYINSFIKETKSSISFPMKVDLGTWEDMINENNESIVCVYQTTIDDYKYRKNHSKDILISNLKSREEGRVIISELIELDINWIWRYYIKTNQGDSLIGTIKVEPKDWY